MDLAISIKKAIEEKQTDVAAQKITSENVKDMILWKDPLDLNSSLLHVIAKNKGVADILNTFMQLVEPSDVEAWVTHTDCSGRTCLHVAAILTNDVFKRDMYRSDLMAAESKNAEFLEKLLDGVVSHIFIHSST